MKSTWAWLSVLLLGTAWCSLPAGFGRQQEQAPVAAPITDGATLFQERGCSQCHTIRGSGGHKGPDLSAVGRRLKKDAIEKQIEAGGAAMPAFGDALPHEEIAALTEYLHARRDKKPLIKGRATRQQQ